MDLSVLPPRKTILLTGAGFSKPFGGLLANEMWAAILMQPEVRETPKLRGLLLGDLNFENLYTQVLSDERHAFLRPAFSQALRNAYVDMDEALRTHAQRARDVCQALLVRFAPTESERDRGFLFTLNQDLLVERYYSGPPLLVAPGFVSQQWFGNKWGDPLSRPDREEIPSPEQLAVRSRDFLERKTERFAYVKLHGSIGWKGRSDVDVMVIGTTKAGQIDAEPLLGWYWSLFRSVLSQPRRNLVVIGYGFGDPHVNQVIADAIRESGLRLYVVSRESPQAFRNRCFLIHAMGSLEPISNGDVLWSGLHGYHCGSVEDLYSEIYGTKEPTARALLEESGLIARR